MPFVIVGGGQAAGQAAASLRQEGRAEPIVVVAGEEHVPYQRPPLSKQYLAGEYGVERVHLRPAAFYASKNIEVRTGVRAEAVDANARRIALSDGETLPYDKLLLATGATARRLDVPGGELAGVHTLRTIADVDAIKAEFKPGKRVAIVGGGYIGLEVAAVAMQLGLQATVLEMEERLLARVATPELSAFYHRLHSGKGVVVRTAARVESFAAHASDGARLGSVACADGSSVEADLAVVGVGIEPSVELAEQAGLPCRDGIVVDEQARTGNAHIYAAGDCTNHPNPLLGRRLRLESVPNAMEQSRVAATNMAGGDKSYASMPWFWSDQYDVKLQIVGFPEADDLRVMRGDPETHQFATFYLRGGVLTAAEAINSAREFLAARQLIGKSVDPRQLADTAVDLRSVVQAAKP